MSGASADLHEKIHRLPVLSAHLKEMLPREALSDPFKVFPGPRGALALTVSREGSGKDCVLPYIHLLYIKRLDREIVLRFSMAEVRSTLTPMSSVTGLPKAFRSVAGFLISYRDTSGAWHQLSWDGKEATEKAAPSQP
jgi:hypothetical protein